MATVHPPVAHSVPTMTLKSATSATTVINSQQDVPSIPYTIDDLLRRRAKSHTDTPLLAYPRSALGSADFAEYTANDLDRFADEIARSFQSQGLRPANPNVTPAEVVALLGPSNLDYIATIAGLHRLGYACLLLSTRLSTEAYVNLLRKTNSRSVIVAPNHMHALELIQQELPIISYPIPEQSSYDVPVPSGPRYEPPAPSEHAAHRTAFIIHSSGSTGLPKPIFQTHRACLVNYSSGAGYRAFLTLPLYHNHGISTFFRGIFSGNTTFFFNANLPLTGPNLLEAMKAAQPQSWHGVPYGLKLLGETDEGVQALAKCSLVLYGGSSCPDELGDRLVEAGVYLVGHYGATEMGQLMTSHRKGDDKAWNYMRPIASAAPYLLFDPIGDGKYECVVLSGLPTKVMSNCDDPPDSFRTRDIFAAHPTIRNAWKHLGRIDDRVTLVNGEKVLPVPYENQVRENEHVKEACIFGVSRAFPGICIFPSEKGAAMSKAALLEALTPVIEAANARVEGFSQISPEMIEIMDFGTEYPQTDKGTLIRAAFYKTFESTIDSVYKRFETFDAKNNAQQRALSIPELEQYLLDVFRSRIRDDSLEVDTDFFAMGVDSLQALAARGRILREIDLGGKSLGQNVIFEYPNVRALARHIYALRTGEQEEERSEIEEMRKLIEKYSAFPARTSETTRTPSKETIILTGATGSLGAHVLAQLLDLESVRRICCLVRADSPASAIARVRKTLSDKGLNPDLDDKVICLPSDFSREDLGLSKETLDELRENLTAVIHSAWAVNFNLGVRSFEQQHIRGTYNLLNLCLSVSTPQPAKLLFCSSISAAAGTPLPATIKETHIEELSHAQNMGYARSKLVTEHIVKASAEQTGMCARVLRIGQIVGDSQHGKWNTTEAIPLMIQSATTIGALPALDETPSWMPVDRVARSIIELSGLTMDSSLSITTTSNASTVYHVQNKRLFHWTRDLLPALRAAGLDFKTVQQREWVQLLRAGEQDPTKNPTIKLLDFFAEKYDNDRPGRSGLMFETLETENASETMAKGFDVVGNGLIGKCVEEWRKVW